MLASHHGPEQEAKNREIMERFIEQAQGKPKRQYSAGRINGHDDGDLALAVTADPTHKTVIVRFGKPVEWIGLRPEEAVGLAQLLIKHARKVSDKPLSVSL